MGAVLSSAAAVVDAAMNYARRRLIAGDADWSALPYDLLVTIMARLDIPDLGRSGAVCTSWRHAHDAFGLPTLERAPCLLYACEEYGPNDLALYCPTTNATFRVPFPGPPHHERGFTFSCPGGLVFTTDEVGNPYLINPLTGVSAALPPVRTIDCNDTYYDDAGKNVWWEGDPDQEGILPNISWARHESYLRVAISAATEVTECTVLIVNMPDGMLSFARPGDKRWTLLSRKTFTVSDILYNDNDGLFYILYGRGSISTVDLSAPSPFTTTIMPRVINLRRFWGMYLALGPSGELLQVWRNWEHKNTPRRARCTYKDMVNGACQDYVDFSGQDDDDNKLSDLETNEEEDELYDSMVAHQEIDVSRLIREGVSMRHLLTDEVATNELLVFKVDIERQKLVELRDIGDHALFLGCNSAMCLPTKDFPAFEPNCAYLTDDCYDYTPMLRKDIGTWNIKERSMQKLGDTWPNMHPWLHLPAPIWIMPRL